MWKILSESDNIQIGIQTLLHSKVEEEICEGLCERRFTWKRLLKRRWWAACFACCRSMQHSVLTRVGHRSWLDGFDPAELSGRAVAVCVLEDNTVALLKFQPNKLASEQQWSVAAFAIPKHFMTNFSFQCTWTMVDRRMKFLHNVQGRNTSVQ